MTEFHENTEPENTFEKIQPPGVTARVPEHISGGVFATGAIVMFGPHEFMIDFVQTLAQPRQVMARVVMAPAVAEAFIRTLQDNLDKYSTRFGDPPQPPRPKSSERRPGFAEVYENLKVPETMAGGCYCNMVMVGHSPNEFCFDFITRFLPKASVSARVFMSVPQAVALHKSLDNSYQQFARQHVDRSGSQGPTLPPDDADPSTSDGML